MLSLDGGGGSGSLDDEEEDDDAFSATSTDFNGGTIDLGQGGTGATSGNLDFENNDAGVVDTGDDIADAGGPEAVLVGNEEQARSVTDAISEVTGQLRDAASSDSSSDDAPVDNTDQNVAGSPPVDLDDLPVGFGGLGLPSLPSVGEIGGKGVALALAGLGAAAVVFGGD